MNSIKVQAAHYLYQCRTNRRILKEKIARKIRKEGMSRVIAFKQAALELGKDDISVEDCRKVSPALIQRRLETCSPEQKPVLEKALELLNGTN